MAITKEDKKIIQNAIQKLDVKKMYNTVEDDQKKKWFRFGAYDALRMVSEMLESYPETKSESKHVGIKIEQPDD